MVKKFILFFGMVLVSCQLSSCQTEPILEQEKEQNLVVNINDYSPLFKENNVEANIIQENEEDYLEITFPDGTVAFYKDQLIYIQKTTNKEKYGDNYNVLLEICIIDDNTASVNVESTNENKDRGGSVSGNYILPDFSEIISHGWEPSINDLGIKKWFPTEELAAVYSQAKSMEELIKQYNEKLQ